MENVKYPRGYSKPPYIQISIRTKLNMRDREVGRRLVDVLWGKEPRYTPTKISLDFEKSITCENLEFFLDHWFLTKDRKYHGVDYQFPKKLWWKNKGALRCDGSFIHQFKATSGKEVPGSLLITFAFLDRIDWKEMFLSLCDMMQPQLGMMHLFSSENCPPSKRESDFQTGNFSGLSDPKIPGLGWMFAAGNEYYDPISKFDVQGLGVKRLDRGTFCTLEIAKSADEILVDLESFERRRSRLLEVFPLPIVEKYDSLSPSC